jgi:hypothetical protein
MEIKPEELVALVQSSPKNDENRSLGQNIVVLDRGFVYVGDVVEGPEKLTISNAKNIRRWGTTKGLGELTSGPLEDTIIDPVGVVVCYRKAVIHLIPCKGF